MTTPDPVRGSSPMKSTRVLAGSQHVQGAALCLRHPQRCGDLVDHGGRRESLAALEGRVAAQGSADWF
jgi:hypothetical protein